MVAVTTIEIIEGRKKIERKIPLPRLTLFTIRASASASIVVTGVVPTTKTRVLNNACTKAPSLSRRQ
ncbi:MAG: hypothetical protein ACD_39C01946G0001 [uncultured bacterium]|nr:MAG: hypothetical protein ACD_39C01946G0001 [uncultured bacterium]